MIISHHPHHNNNK